MNTETLALDALQTLSSRVCSSSPGKAARSSCGGSGAGEPPVHGQKPSCLLCIHCPKCADKTSGATCDLCRACHACTLRGGCGK